MLWCKMVLGLEFILAICTQIRRWNIMTKTKAFPEHCKVSLSSFDEGERVVTELRSIIHAREQKPTLKTVLSNIWCRFITLGIG